MLVVIVALLRCYFVVRVRPLRPRTELAGGTWGAFAPNIQEFGAGRRDKGREEGQAETGSELQLMVVAVVVVILGVCWCESWDVFAILGVVMLGDAG